jgi:hypothetical protein
LVSTDYAYIYNTTIVPSIPAETDVPLDTNGLIVGGISHTPGSAEILITSSGVYSIMFTVVADRVNQFALFLNGVLIPGSIYGVGAANVENTGHVIVSITAPATLTIRNHTSFNTVALLQNVDGVQDNVNASIQILRIS